MWTDLERLQAFRVVDAGQNHVAPLPDGGLLECGDPALPKFELGGRDTGWRSFGIAATDIEEPIGLAVIEGMEQDAVYDAEQRGVRPIPSASTPMTRAENPGLLRRLRIEWRISTSSVLGMWGRLATCGRLVIGLFIFDNSYSCPTAILEFQDSWIPAFSVYW